MSGDAGPGRPPAGSTKNVLYFKDLTLSVSEWVPFGQNAIATINDTLDSLKGVKESLLSGKVDEAPETSSFSIRPGFTRITIEGFDRYDWIKFTGQVERSAGDRRAHRVGVHMDKSGLVNYGLRLGRVGDRADSFPMDDVTSVAAEVMEDTSVMLDALLTQFQRRTLTLVHGEGYTHQRPKFLVAVTQDLQPEHETVQKYHDGEAKEAEINQLLGITHRFVDLRRGDKLILGTYGAIFISKRPYEQMKVLGLYSAVKALQLFQSTFFSRLRSLWDLIHDLRGSINTLDTEEAIGSMQQQMAKLSTDIVLIEEIMSYMRSASELMEVTWKAQRGGPEASNTNLVNALDMDRELRAVRSKIDDMEMNSSGLVDEIQALRDMLGTLAEKRMREMNRLMTDNVQQGSEAQQTMLANVRASRYSGAALKILSAISAGALGMKIADLIMEPLDKSNEEWGLTILGSDTFSGSYLHLAVGFILWLILAYTFFWLIRSGTERIREQKLAKMFNLHIRFPINVHTDAGTIQRFLESKQVVFYNVEVTGHRAAWHLRIKRDGHEILYVVTMCFEPGTGLIKYVHANTEDRAGDAAFTVDAVMEDLVRGGLLDPAMEAVVRSRMGFTAQGVTGDD